MAKVCGVSAFVRRCRQHTLDMDDADCLFYWVIVPLLIPSGLAGFLIDVESGQWLLWLSFAYFGPFCVAFIGYLAYCGMPRRPSFLEVAWQITWPVPVAALLSFLLFGYILWANALSGSSKPIEVGGQVVAKKNEFARYTGKTNLLTVDYEGKQIDLEVSEYDFANTSVGSRYSQILFRGGLGYFYRWRYEANQG